MRSMTYSSGEAAQIGDWIKGTPFNGAPPEIVVGQVLDLNPDLARQNMQLVTLVRHELPHPLYEFYRSMGVMAPDRTFELLPELRYGECDKFVLVCRGAA